MVKQWKNLTEKVGNDSTIQPRSDFMNKIREVPELKVGYTVYDLDSVITNYKTKKTMFIEIKCHRCKPSWAQYNFLKNLYKWTKDSKEVVGVFILQHENLGPYDGYNILSIFDGKNWIPVKINDDDKLSGDDLFKIIKIALNDNK